MKRLTRMVVLSLVLSMLFSTVSFAAEEDRGISIDGIESSDINKDEPMRPSAPPLTQFYVGGVRSSDHPDMEVIQYSSSFYPVSTTDDHGGTWLRVYTVEIGYAGQRYAYFNNMQMSLENTYPVYVDNDNIVDGYICEWLYQGYFTNGTFKANSTSANSPWNTMNIYSFNIL